MIEQIPVEGPYLAGIAQKRELPIDACLVVHLFDEIQLGRSLRMRRQRTDILVDFIEQPSRHLLGNFFVEATFFV